MRGVGGKGERHASALLLSCRGCKPPTCRNCTAGGCGSGLSHTGFLSRLPHATPESRGALLPLHLSRRCCHGTADAVAELGLVMRGSNCVNQGVTHCLLNWRHLCTRCQPHRPVAVTRSSSSGVTAARCSGRNLLGTTPHYQPLPARQTAHSHAGHTHHTAQAHVTPLRHALRVQPPPGWRPQLVPPNLAGGCLCRAARSLTACTHTLM
jgi:hypothetical protein